MRFERFLLIFFLGKMIRMCLCTNGNNPICRETSRNGRRREMQEQEK